MGKINYQIKYLAADPQGIYVLSTIENQLIIFHASRP